MATIASVAIATTLSSAYARQAADSASDSQRSTCAAIWTAAACCRFHPPACWLSTGRLTGPASWSIAACRRRLRAKKRQQACAQSRDFRLRAKRPIQRELVSRLSFKQLDSSLVASCSLFGEFTRTGKAQRMALRDCPKSVCWKTRSANTTATSHAPRRG